MTPTVEERLARLEESVQHLEDAAAREESRRKNARLVSLGIFIVVGALYAWYLGNLSSLLGGA